jgi:hypothetical protein
LYNYLDSFSLSGFILRTFCSKNFDSNDVISDNFSLSDVISNDIFLSDVGLRNFNSNIKRYLQETGFKETFIKESSFEGTSFEQTFVEHTFFELTFVEQTFVEHTFFELTFVEQTMKTIEISLKILKFIFTFKIENYKSDTSNFYFYFCTFKFRERSCRLSTTTHLIFLVNYNAEFAITR